MPRKTQLFLANFDPPALPAGRSFSEVLAAMNTLLATASPWVRAEAAPVTLPVLVARPGLFGPVELADVGTRLTDLLALSASHGDWAIVGGTLEWRQGGATRRVVPILHDGAVAALLADAPAGVDVDAELATVSNVALDPVRTLATIVVDEVHLAVELDPAGGAIAAYSAVGISGVDLHVVLETRSQARGVPRGHVARELGYVFVCGHEQLVRSVQPVDPRAPGRTIAHPDVDPYPVPPRTRLIAGASFSAVGADGGHAWSGPLALPDDPPDGGASSQSVASSTGAMAALTGETIVGHAREVGGAQALPDDNLLVIEQAFHPTADELARLAENAVDAPAAMNDELRAYALEALMKLPDKHLTSRSATLIVREKGLGTWYSFFAPRGQDRVIAIAIPGKARRLYANFTIASGDKLFMSLQRALHPGWGLESHFAGSIADQASARMTEQLFLKHTVRHEFGHAVDHQIWFTEKLASQPKFGGWGAYSDDREAWLRDMILCAANDEGVGLTHLTARTYFGVDVYGALLVAAEQVEGAPGLTERSLRQKSKERFASGLLDAVTAERPGGVWDKVKLLGEPALRVLRRVCLALDVAFKLPFWRPDGGGVVLDGRIFHLDLQGSPQSYLAAARAHRLSNYQFSNASEWFAESYSFYFDTPEDRGRYLREVGAPLAADWFRENLDMGGALLTDTGLKAIT